MPNSDDLRAVRRAAKKLARAQEEFDASIRKAAALGLSHRQIASAAGRTHPTIKKIIDEGGETLRVIMPMAFAAAGAAGIAS